MKETVKKSLLNIKERFEENHYIFLGEEDVRCHIFSELLKEFNNLEKTEDEKYTIPLHAQISFRSPNNDLKTGKKPDIILINVPSMNLYSDNRVKTEFRLKKGFEFKESPIGIEIKINWNRKFNGIKNHMGGGIKKIRQIQTLNREMFFYLFYVDKKACLSDKEIVSINSGLENIEVIYCKGKN